MVTGRFTKRLSTRAFLRSRSGNVAMMWGLMGTVLIGLVGLSVDFTRANALRNAMQNAADGAALVAERSSNRSMADRTAAARAFFDAEVGDQVATNVSFNVVQLADGGHRVEVSTPMPLGLASVINDEDWTISVAAEAQASASPPIEVALVLDNTGSMAADMNGLRSAASDLAADLLSIDGDSVRVALVPFVAQVNIGNQQSHMAWMDAAGNAPYNGELLEDRMLGYRNVVTSGTEQSNNAYTGANCEALSTRPYFENPQTSGDQSYPGPYRVVWRRGGTLLNQRCFAFTPDDNPDVMGDGINYFTLFNLVGVEWKGCVEARPEPFDVTDAPPDPDEPETMFVPFFWLDTGGNANQASSGSANDLHYRNNNQSYITDTQGNLRSTTRHRDNSGSSGTPGSVQNSHTTALTMAMSNPLLGSPNAQERRESYFFNVFKYRAANASIDTSAPDTRGPNRGCPTPIVPLTENEGVIQSNIAAMQHWMGGGTNQAEGLAWGWRVLSPNAPFTEGEAFNADRSNVRKVIVLMSDGENTNVGTEAVMESDYSAYNYRGFWRTYSHGNLVTQLLFGLLHGILPQELRRDIDSSSEYVTYVNDRERQLCNNIKNEGIEIYTVIFRETDQATENLMRNCASGTDHFYRADNAQELAEAFDAIGTGIGSLRITR
jgi:Flp pilus assembly protein TadG